MLKSLSVLFGMLLSGLPSTEADDRESIAMSTAQFFYLDNNEQPCSVDVEAFGKVSSRAAMDSLYNAAHSRNLRQAQMNCNGPVIQPATFEEKFTTFYGDSRQEIAIYRERFRCARCPADTHLPSTRFP